MDNEIGNTSVILIDTHHITAADKFERATAIIYDNLSISSRRVYQNTHSTWRAFAAEEGMALMDLSIDNIHAFIYQADVAKSTRKNRLSHLRKLLELLAIADGAYRQHYETVKSFLKVKISEGDLARSGRYKRALSTAELSHFLNVWRYDTTNIGLRNNAMMRLLVFTGLRGSELVALTWQDIDRTEMTIIVRHGKGDKERNVALVDHSPVTKIALQALTEAQGGVYHYVYPRMTAGRNPLLAADVPVFDQKVALIVKNTARKAGIGHVAPHNLRRTHITTALNGGSTVADMQAQAGHVNAATTLRYAQAHEAQERRRRISFPVV